MADALFVNTLNDIEILLNVTNGLPISTRHIKEAITTAIFERSYDDIYTINVNKIGNLSCNLKIATCESSYYGSGMSSICVSSWDDLNITIEPIFTKLMNQPAMLAISNMFNSINNSTIKNNLSMFIELYALEIIYNSSDEDLKGFWIQNLNKNFTDKLKICSSAFCMGCGATCAWTVPENTTIAKFQVWGAGTGTNPSCCCGGSPFGANGAYAELTLKVIPGNIYTACAGCSCSISCCSSTTPGNACMSGVTGPGICCLKADGSHYCNKVALNGVRVELGGSICCRFENPYCISSGSCWCYYSNYCSASCATCGVVPVHADCCTGRTYCACGTDTATIFGTGIKPIHGGGCFDSNNYGYHTRPPILDADTCLAFTEGCSIGTFTSEACAGGNAGNSWCRHPGMGGAFTHEMSGSNTNLGGIGTGGMIQISWR